MRVDPLFSELVKTLQTEQRQAEQRANELLDISDYVAIKQIKRIAQKETEG
ncbi:hypothetical protein [Aneurinibacillus danicus]|jgi:hypothetical protein|uniref:Uncharacterized protein n=1 Tax=Aneurinibacillus danicus TaxID=267746 RepID=A0A511VBA5_9BACL|nr:hypothetical protein [Aneurinibacillus danicus]GEN34843.1 hypothetical protein ADA01nite_23030 [Aneurinibacillus danicus]